MKKIIITILALLCIFTTISFSACKKEEEPTKEEPKMAIDLRSPEIYEMVFGESYKIAYRVAGSSQGVIFNTQNSNVVTVDDFGNVKAVGVGESEVTISLKENDKISTKMLFKVSKEFFYNQKGYRNGNFNLSTIEDGYVEIKGDQTQLLVSEYSENWYFKCRIEHSGRNTNYDSNGRFGIGSFNVSKDVPIGHMMAWFGFIPKNYIKQTYIPYVGGWRVFSANMDPDIYFTSDKKPMDLMEGGAVLELIRNGTKHYYTVTAGGETYKYVYDCPAYEGIPTWPGVYSQNQIIDVYEFEASSNLDVVIDKLNNFQKAEQIEINGITDYLIAGLEYDLTAKVMPETTFNKSASYELVEAKEGVTLTKEGKLTIKDSVSGQITIKAVANSNSAITNQKTYNIIGKPNSESTIIDTNLVVGNGVELINNNSLSISNGVNYIPLIANKDKWMASFTVNSAITSGKLGFMSATNGFMKTAAFNILGASSSIRQMEMSAIDEKYTTFAYTNLNANIENNKITLIKDLDNYYVLVNDVLVKKVKLSLSEATMPAIYAENINTTLSNIEVNQNASDVLNKVNSFDKIKGGYVIKDGNSYIIAKKDFGNANDMNWPPVNDYENGIKSIKTFNSNFSISFKLSNISPMLTNGAYDSKILVYLRSEKTTASVQFVIKGTQDAPVVSFCPNLNDATWIEYPMPAGVNLLQNENDIKVVREGSLVSVYINNTRVFEDNVALNAYSSFTENMQFTPGIGTFMCGATISNVVFEEV